MNKHNTYTPEAQDLSAIGLPDDLDELLEQIARNVHDTWAQARLSEGWTYGPERNDAAKTHPCLVPYEELPEVEKEYDRNTAAATLKMVIKMGYEIKKKR